MKFKAVIILLLLISHNLFGQDGSDIIYLDEKEIDQTVIGKFIQIDFYNFSFGSNKYDSQNINIEKYNLPKKDTINVFFENKLLDFVEIRNDDGLNNWFNEQYLETIKTFENKKIRIEKMKVLDVQNDSIKVKLFGHYYVDEQIEKTAYLTNVVSFNRNAIHQLLIDSTSQFDEGLSIYQVYYNLALRREINEQKCKYCFEVSENNIYNTPLLSAYHIKYYDFEKQKIELTEAGKQIVENLEIPLEGMPVVLTLNGEIIYEFWFWNLYSSFACNRVFTYPKLDFELKFGLPDDNRYGIDPRFDERLKKYYKKK